VALKVDPGVLSYSGEWFTVTFSGVPAPAATDFLAAYAPATADLNQTAPVKASQARQGLAVPYKAG
jgi:hypothetical protein